MLALRPVTGSIRRIRSEPQPRARPHWLGRGGTWCRRCCGRGRLQARHCRFHHLGDPRRGPGRDCGGQFRVDEPAPRRTSGGHDRAGPDRMVDLRSCYDVAQLRVTNRGGSPAYGVRIVRGQHDPRTWPGRNCVGGARHSPAFMAMTADTTRRGVIAPIKLLVLLGTRSAAALKSSPALPSRSAMAALASGSGISPRRSASPRSRAA